MAEDPRHGGRFLHCISPNLGIGVILSEHYKVQYK